MVRIPSEYQEVEYIESTGMQYIDTGYIPVLSPILRMKIRITNRDDKDIAGFVSNVYPSFIIDAAPFQSRWYNRYGNTAAYSYGVTPSPVIGQIQEWEWGKEVKFNGNLVHTNTECDWSSNTQKMNIFSGRNKAFVAIYTCSLYDGDLVRNLIPCYHKTSGEIGMYDTVTGAFFTNQGTGTFLKGNDVTYDTVNLMESRRRILLNTPHVESLSGSMLQFATDMKSKLKECKIHFTPVQEGSGDPSPDNVRPISGWDGVTVTRCGKNLFDASGEYLNNKWINNNGKIVDSLNNRPTLLYTQKIPVASGTAYTIHGACNNIQYIRIVYYDENDNFLGRVVSDGKPNPSKKFTPITGTAYVLVNPDTAIQNIQLEKGSSATTYEPYTSQSLTIPFPQTIYGGYVDLVKGEVVEEYGAFEFTGDENINYATNWNAKGNYYVNTLGAVPFCSQSDVNNIYCNILKPRSSSFFSVNEGMVSTQGGDTDVERAYRYIIIGKDGFGETVDECKAKLKELYDAGTPLTVVSKYAKAFVKTHQLTPQTIKTLRGINNFWSDANGNIELKFWTH